MPRTIRYTPAFFVVLLAVFFASVPCFGQGVTGACLFSLDPSASQAFYVSGSTEVATGCSIAVESSSVTAFVVGTSNTVDLQKGAQVGVVGGWQLGGKLLNTVTNQYVQPISISNPGDPFAAVQAPTPGSINIVSQVPVSYSKTNPPINNTISPGVY
jgi:hypothetical protein